MKKVNLNKEDIQKVTKNTKGLIGEFKIFIKRGNVLDLAVGVIMGGAFGKIVSSLVDNILMPIIGALIGGHDFSNLSIMVGSANIKYGLFIQNIIDFLIVSICIFFLVKSINKFLNSKQETKEEIIKSDELKVLEEIRDELKNK
jgi:large conductance mechanosensitive channel